ncbi:MAG: ferrous iron transport protein A [Firmicutes bacterium]|nr:ferrous iron transport protein A [Bacillota bacterium]
MQLLPLDTLGPQIQSIIVGINCQGWVRRRLMDMGLTPGTRIMVEGTAPLGDPIIVWARGCRLALRRLEAAQISVKPCPGAILQPVGQPHGRLPRRGLHRRRWGHGAPGKGRGRRGRRGSGPKGI